jgi:translocation and assembly module TamB
MNRRKIAAGIGLLLFVVLTVVASAAVYLHSRGFREYALDKIIETAQQKTGAQIEIRDVNVSWRPLTVQVNGVHAFIPGGSHKPLATIERVTVTMTPWQLLHRQVAIEKLSVDQPAIYVRVSSDGRLNLPTPPPGGSASSSFAVHIASVSIQDGLIDYEDRKIPLAADLRGFQAQAVFDRASGAYRGQLSYDAGRVTTSDVRPVEHRAAVRFVADSRACRFEGIDVTAMHSSLTLHGSLGNYASPVFLGDYSGSVSANDLRWILKNDAMPGGEIAVQGDVLYRNKTNSTFLNDLRLQGRMQSRRVVLPVDGNEIAVEMLDGSYSLEKGVLRVVKLTGGVLGGRLKSEGATVALNRDDGDVRLRIQQASLEKVRVATTKSNPTARHPGGVADVEARASWKNGVRNLHVQAKVDIRSPGSAQAANQIPLNGHLDLDYDAAQSRVAVGQSNLSTGQTQLAFSGTVATNSSLNLHLFTNDLEELAALATSLSNSFGTQKNNAIPNIKGAAEFTGSITGTAKNPHIDGQIAGRNVHYEKTALPTLAFHVAIDSRSLALSNGRAALSDKARVTFQGRASLVHWLIDPKAPLFLHATTSNVPAGQIENLAHVSYPIEGLLNGEVSLSGSIQELAGQGHLTLAQARMWGEPLNTLSMDFMAHDQQIEFSGKAQAPAGVLNAEGKYELDSRKYEIKATADGLKIEQVHLLQAKEPSARGVLTADISGTGTVDDPQATVKLRIASLHLREVDMSELDADGKLQHKHGQFAVHFLAQDNPVDLKGTIELTPGYPVRAMLDTGKMPIGRLLTRFSPKSPQSELGGELEIHANMEGPLETPEKLRARVEIPTLHMKAQSFEMANEQRVVLVYQDAVLRVENGRFKGTGSDLNISGDVPVQGGAMNLTAKGTLDLKALAPWTDGGEAAGQVNFEVRARGSRSKPDIQGLARLVNVAYTSESLPVGIESLNGEMLLEGSRIRLSNVSANAGGGTLAVAGSAIYGDNTTFDLAVDAKSVRIRQNGIHAVVNANVAWNGSVQSSAVSGNVTIGKLTFSQGSDLAEIAGQFSDSTISGEPPAIERNAKLNVTVQSGDALRVATNQLSVAGAVDLTAIGTLARPVLLGRVGLTGGEVFFLGKRFEIHNGTLAFANSYRTDPVLNLYVSTVVQQYNITINMTGTTDHLRTVYSSDPALPSADIINLLAFGQTTADAAASATPASVGAESAVASAVGGQVASQVQKLAGISQLTINPLAGNNSNPGAQIAVQQRVTGNVLLTFSTNATSAQNQTVQVQYQPKKNVTVSVLRDEYGGYGIDVRYRKAF